MQAILGKKLGMTRIFKDKEAIPVTVIKAGPCWVTQVKTEKEDGYNAIQVGFGEAKNITKPQKGHFKKLKPAMDREPNFKYLTEFKFDPEKKEYKPGDKIELDFFQEGDKIKVTGTTKGKGFQGVVKRHGFSGGPASHGTKDTHRTPGSIGSAYPERVRKGKKMAGRMGGGVKTIPNLEVVEIDKEKNILNVKGSVPGNKGNVVIIQK